ncbi:MAG: hypothetical protein HW413_2702 [Thermoleophilia bacterium]|nr:hypothetical protein [Thermoleophilia bacterium]
MDTATAATTAPSRGWLMRWSPLGGLVYVIGLVILFLTPAGDEAGDTAAEVVSNAEANENWYGALVIFGLVGLLLIAWFVAGLAVRLRDSGARDEGTVAFAGGITFATLSFMALNIFISPLFSITEEDTQDAKLSAATTFLNVDDIGWVALGGAGVAAGLMAIAASIGAMRTRSTPTWAGVIGILLGVASLATIAFVGIFAWLAWILLASVAMLIRR